MRKFNFVYKTTNLLNSIFYIGVHSTDDLEDGYLGSGLLLLKAIKKHGKGNFKREFIQFFDTKEEAYSLEKQLVTEVLIKSRKSYNRAVGGQGGFLGNEAVELMRQSKKGKVPWNKGKTGIYSIETRSRISTSLKGRKIEKSPIKNLTKENCNWRRQQAESLKCNGKVKGKNNPSWKGYYITPFGKFETPQEASKILNIPARTIYQRCTRAFKRFPGWFCER